MDVGTLRFRLRKPLLDALRLGMVIGMYSKSPDLCPRSAGTLVLGIRTGCIARAQVELVAIGQIGRYQLIVDEYLSGKRRKISWALAKD